MTEKFVLKAPVEAVFYDGTNAYKVVKSLNMKGTYILEDGFYLLYEHSGLRRVEKDSWIIMWGESGYVDTYDVRSFHEMFEPLSPQFRLVKGAADG
ncbi:MAG: hypothetical protein LBQ12_14500 [Deltaproteobacteria bacterium]|jgi:hypothetical protein|nr:hypothetical protein [Deltaproteobacteria bacterium]